MRPVAQKISDITSCRATAFPNAVPTIIQIKNYLAANQYHARATALYVISSGDNDVTFALKHPGNKNLSDEGRELARERNQKATASRREIHYCRRSPAVIRQHAPRKNSFASYYNTRAHEQAWLRPMCTIFGPTQTMSAKLMESYNTNPPTPNPFGITNFTIGKTGCTTMCPDSACSMPKMRNAE